MTKSASGFLIAAVMLLTIQLVGMLIAASTTTGYKASDAFSMLLIGLVPIPIGLILVLLPCVALRRLSAKVPTPRVMVWALLIIAAFMNAYFGYIWPGVLGSV